MTRIFQITMIAVALVPFALGVMNLIGGAAAFVPPDIVTPEFDGQMRFYAVWFMFPLFISIWAVRNMDIAGPVLLIAFGTMALGGAARVSSFFLVGIPDPTAIVAAVVELATLLFVPWHRAVIGRNMALA
jgi:hypothetical protein